MFENGDSCFTCLKESCRSGSGEVCLRYTFFVGIGGFTIRHKFKLLSLLLYEIITVWLDAIKARIHPHTLKWSFQTKTCCSSSCRLSLQKPWYLHSNFQFHIAVTARVLQHYRLFALDLLAVWENKWKTLTALPRFMVPSEFLSLSMELDLHFWTPCP